MNFYGSWQGKQLTQDEVNAALADMQAQCRRREEQARETLAEALRRESLARTTAARGALLGVLGFGALTLACVLLAAGGGC